MGEKKNIYLGKDKLITNLTLRIHQKTDMGIIGYLLDAGLFPALIVVLFMKFDSLKLRKSILNKVSPLFFFSIWQKKNFSQFFLKTSLISTTHIISFYLLIVNELPGVWISILVFLIIVIAGSTFLKIKFLEDIGFFLVKALFSIFLIPQIISKGLTKEVNETAVNFKFIGLTTSSILVKSDFKNSVSEIDDFCTCCPLCISEINYLEKATSHFPDLVMS